MEIYLHHLNTTRPADLLRFRVPTPFHETPASSTSPQRIETYRRKTSFRDSKDAFFYRVYWRRHIPVVGVAFEF
jgi:hypothetical protein